MLGMLGLYIFDSGSKHNDSTRSGVRCIVDPCNVRCVPRASSYWRNGELLDISPGMSNVRHVGAREASAVCALFFETLIRFAARKKSGFHFLFQDQLKTDQWKRTFLTPIYLKNSESPIAVDH